VYIVNIWVGVREFYLFEVMLDVFPPYKTQLFYIFYLNSQRFTTYKTLFSILVFLFFLKKLHELSVFTLYRVYIGSKRSPLKNHDRFGGGCLNVGQ
jgi:hypothetical protein